MSKIFLLLGIVALSAGPAGATSMRSYFSNRDGIKKFQQESYRGAYQDFLRALEDEPLSPEIQMNLARTFEANEEFDKAERAYLGALKVLPENSPLRFDAHFNRAGALAKLKRIPEALTAYQAALDLNPDSLEVKTNIELLFQGGGGGGGEQDQDKGDQNQDQKDKGKGQNPDDKPNEDKGNKKQKPKPFESQELSEQDVKRILDEIKNQEQNIRAQEQRQGAKEAPKDKDW